jgi:curved DNA-binding protein CbpA
LTLFELLGLQPTATDKELRKAYFVRSKEFHPDRYFKKDLGPYKGMLQEIFKQLRAAYKFLGDRAQREAYRDMVVQQGEQEALAREVEQQGLEAQREDEASQKRGNGHGASSGVHYVKGQTFKDRKRQPGPRSEHVRRAFAEMVKGRPDPAKIKEALQQRRAEKEQQRSGQYPEVEAPPKRKRTATSGFFSRSKRAREFFEQGMRQLEKGQYLAATASLKLASSYEPDNDEYATQYRAASEKSRASTAENAFKRGVFEESVGRFDAAGASFIRAADQFPKAIYCYKAAEACLWNHDLIKAKDYATQAVRLDPKDVNCRITLAKVYIEAKMAKNAKRELQEALRLEPDNADAKKLIKTMHSGR